MLSGKLTRKVTVKDMGVTKGARAAIEAAGGAIVDTRPKPEPKQPEPKAWVAALAAAAEKPAKPKKAGKGEKSAKAEKATKPAKPESQPGGKGKAK
jgi:hypothetical protein